MPNRPISLYSRLAAPVIDIVPEPTYHVSRSSYATPQTGALVPPYRRPRVSHPEPRAPLAAFLSFLFSGLGQAYNGHAVLAGVLAAPMLLLVLGAALTVVLAQASIGARLFDIRFLVALIVLDLAVLGWRAFAILHAHVARQSLNLRLWTTHLTVVLLLITVAMHGVPAFYALKGIETINSVSLGGDRDSHGGIGEVPEVRDLPEPSDQPDPRAGDRVNILLVGVDAAPGRSHQLTDTMLVVSLGSAGERSAMISIPRDLYGAPLPDGRLYNNKLNSLMTRANNRPSEFPLGGVGTLKATIGGMLGVDIHYFAAISLLGFKQGIDAIGGVEVDVERAINDPSYSGVEGQRGFHLAAGRHWMDGDTALAYVRSRLGVGDSDFTRADRQQQLLAAVRQKLTAHNLVVVLPGLLDAVRASLATDVPGNRISDLAMAVQEVDMSRLERIVLTPPEYFTVEVSHPTAGYVLHPHLEEIRAVGQRLAGDR
jgi:LCP family protein required for cell wall assembly